MIQKYWIDRKLKQKLTEEQYAKTLDMLEADVEFHKKTKLVEIFETAMQCAKLAVRIYSFYIILEVNKYVFR